MGILDKILDHDELVANVSSWIIVITLCLGVLFFNHWFPIMGLGVTQGEHTGIVTAVEDNSFLYHSPLVYFKTDATSTQEDRYCVQNQTLRRMLEEMSVNQTKITVYYASPMIMWKWDCYGGSEIIYDMKRK